ncbi:MAG TPA: methyltransferase [Methylomirabilota bacterium]|nr:methyltransferase [Methylomirabilota bacterium]
MDSEAQSTDAARLRSLITGYEASQVIYVAARLGVADLLGEEPRTAEELAEALHVDAGALQRVLHALAALGLLAHLGESRYALTGSGGRLRAGVPGSLRAVALLSGERSYRAWGGLLHSVRTGETAFPHVFGMGTFEYMAAHPEVAGFYNEAMAAGAAERAAAVVAAYDFSGGGTVVDVGGGHGTLLIAILSANPAARGVLFERESAAVGARARIEEAGLGSRCAVVTGDFFHSVPGDGRVYLLSHIVHNWDDQRCGTILANCRAAMSPRAKLLVLEQVLPERFEPSREAVRASMADLHMLAITGGQERTAGEYRRLFAAAGFSLTSVIGTAVAESLVEGIPV